MIPTSFLQDALIRYCESNSNVHKDYLKQIERMTHLTTLAPQMLSGSLQGKILSFISKLKRPKTALEIGTFTGYSALCIAEGLQNDGELHTFEVDSQYDNIIQYIKENIPLSRKITFHHKDAIIGIPELNLMFDLIFIDASKKDYLHYLNVLKPYMQIGTIIIGDNVLWSGKVLDEKKDQETKILDDYNSFLRESDEWDVFILPFRDGISIATKIS